MSEPKEAVLKYLKSTNRPYSANDIHQNMRGDNNKTVIQKALDQLVIEKKIREKIYNKQKIYSALQKSNGGDYDIQKDVLQLESEILQKTKVLHKLEEELKLAHHQLEKYQSMLTIEEAEKKKIELLSNINSLKNKFKILGDNQILISEADRDKIEKDYSSILKTYKYRKRICMDILYSILENYPKSKAKLIEEIGLELDDESAMSILNI